MGSKKLVPNLVLRSALAERQAERGGVTSSGSSSDSSDEHEERGGDNVQRSKAKDGAKRASKDR